MPIAIKLPDQLVNDARRYGEVYSRSVTKQIEYWARIGKLAVENPDLPYSFIATLLIAQHEEATPFHFHKD